MGPGGTSETAFRCGRLYPKCFVLALAEILFKAQAALNDFLFKAWRAGFVARWNFISILLTAKRAKFLFKRAGDGRALRRLELPLFGFGFLVLPHQSSPAALLGTLLG